MTIGQQRRVRELFDAALDQPSGQRREFLAAACQGDVQVQAEVERLLRANERSAGILDTPIRPRVEYSASPFLPGSFIGSYKILQELSGGGMGIVYQAVRADEVFQRVCAIKVIRPELCGGWLVERFRRERQILGRLDHVNIARIVDGGSTPEGLPYFVMDYVDGSPIHKFCARHSLSARQRLALFQQACSAVRYIHQNGVIHGDLKPSNILVGHDGTVKLVDFGIASALSDLTDVGRNSPPALMTPKYASPEQLQSERLTPVSDVYSLGVILNELLTGTPPIPAASRENPAASASGLPSDSPTSPGVLADSASNVAGGAKVPARKHRSELGSIVLRAMDRDAGRRYGSVEALSQDISSFLQSRPVTAHAGGALYRSRKFLARHAAAAVATPVFVFLIAMAFWQGVELHKRYERAQLLEDQVRILQSQIEEEQRELGAGPIASPSVGATGKPAYNLQLRETQLKNISNLANAYHTNFTESVRLWPGMTRRRRELLTQTGRYLHQAEPFVGQTPGAQEQLASAWMQLANLEGNPKSVNLHDQSSALASIKEAVRLLGTSLQAPARLKEQVQTTQNQIEAGKK